MDHLPFWDAMGVVVHKTGCDVAAKPAGFVVLRGDYRGGGPLAVQGPFITMVQLVEVRRRAEVYLDGDSRRTQTGGYVEVRVRIKAEPSLHVLKGHYAAQPTEAVDDRGNSLVPRQPIPGLGIIYNTGNPNMWNATFGLSRPENLGKKIVRLRGTVRYATDGHNRSRP